MGGPFSESEKAFNREFAALKVSIKKHTERIHTIIENSLKAPKRSNVYWKAVKKDLDYEYAQLYKIYGDWNSKHIPLMYQSQLSAVNKQISKMANVATTATKTISELMAGQAAKQITSALYQDSMASWLSSLTAGKTNILRLTRMTQQALIEEWTIDKAVAKSIEDGNLRYFAGKLAQNSPQYAKLLEAHEAERYIQAGAKKFTPEYYAEMVARVKFHEAQSSAALAQAVNYGTDLMVVSSHNTQTKICLQYEGKIFSISGKDARFPPLTAYTPFHVNCLHLMFPQFESALEASGTLSGFSEFSQGKTETPPAPASFIPASKREVV